MTESHLPDVTVPDELLLPLLEYAADTLGALDPIDVPSSLRQIRTFDRRRLLAGPARRQLRRALEQDEQFRASVLDGFCARPDVQAAAESWSVGQAAAVVESAEARRDLPLLASALWAALPPGGEFGLGLVVARAEEARRAEADAETARAHDRAMAAVDEARRRSDVARAAAETEAERVTAELQRERRARRERDERARADTEAAQGEAQRLAARLEQALASIEEERGRAARDGARVRALEKDLAQARADLARARAVDSESIVEPGDARAVADAAKAAEAVAASLRALEGRLRATPAREAPPAPARPRPAAPTARTAPALPAGLSAESRAGIEAMLGTRDVTLVVDGYNITKAAWPDSTASDQRDRLHVALTGLHRRLGCDVVVVFDGDGTVGVRSPRLDGVRVRFSDAGEEADEVVVRVAEALPKRFPAVVASSDAWVQEHARAAGAVVVSAEALLQVLRPAR